jgi:NAD(P)-dependent dehydrogenase (short-subunit alcohol dehydrogenase family)
VPALDGKTVLLTGATGGIGVELARSLAGAGARVVLACRDLERGAALARTLGARANAAPLVQPLDLASLASVRGLARWAQGELPRLDVLIHNAAVWSRQRRLTAEGFELTFGVNHLAPFALTAALMPLLRQGRARVITVSSGMHARGKLAWDDLMQAQGGFNGTRAYQQSKLASVMFALALARRGGAALVSHALHPGVVRTALTREYPELWKVAPPGQTTAVLAAANVLRLAADPALARGSGRYFNGDREQAPARTALVIADQDRLWTLSEQLVAENQ